MSIKKILKENTGEELAESTFLPARLTKKQRAKADLDLAEHRRLRRETMSSEEKMRYQLMQLKFRLENYIKEGQYDPEHHFGYFLDQYLQVTGRKKGVCK